MILLIQAVILSIIQGITEWFPISSSGHLAILHRVFDFQNISFDVFLHFASILAIILILWKDIIRLLNIKNKENIKYIFLIIVAIIPAVIMGFLFKDKIESFFNNFFYLGIFFIISGILVYSTKFANEKRLKISFFDSIFVGIFQAIALLPGISRSGATISSGMLLGLKKQEAVKFSFLLAIPVVLGASLIELKDLVVSDIDYLILISSFLITFSISLITIKLFFRIVRSGKFYVFGIYNFGMGILVLGWSFII